MVSVSRRCLHLIRVLTSITHVLKNTLNRARVQRQRGGQVGEKENERGRSQGHGDAIIRCFDLGFMCRPCVGALCLSAPQRDMTAWVEQLITKFFKAKKKKKKIEKTGNNTEWENSERKGGDYSQKNAEGMVLVYKWSAKILMDRSCLSGLLTL